MELDADPETLEAASNHAATLLEKLREITLPNETLRTTEAQAGQNVADDHSDSTSAEQPAKHEVEKPKRKRGGAKPRNWQFLPELLTNDQWQKVAEFVAEKKPKTQNEKVAVFCSVLRSLLGRDGFDGNEIHTAFKSLGDKTPSSLSGVFGNMASEGLGHTIDGKFHLDFKGNQLVDHDLPKTESDK
ncbi:hypothetical protein AL073_00565 [Loktanella sp. 1ANDIMAR09]|nr:hypothetical protein AL073_00565 [Loktanella sp. 1ANDIMAR09]